MPKSTSRRSKDPRAPKRPLTAYFLFSAEHRSQFEKGTPVAEQAKKLGEQWRELSDEDKQPFVDKAAKAKEAYAVTMQKYKQSGAGDSWGGVQSAKKRMDDAKVEFAEAKEAYAQARASCE